MKGDCVMKVRLYKILETISENVTEICLGLIFFVYGLSGFFNFFSSPTPLPESHEFLYGLSAAPYFFPLLKGAEVLCGFALIINRCVKLSLVALAPIIINIILFHLFLDLSVESMIVPSLITVFYVALLWKYRKDFKILMEK